MSSPVSGGASGMGSRPLEHLTCGGIPAVRIRSVALTSLQYASQPLRSDKESPLPKVDLFFLLNAEGNERRCNERASHKSFPAARPAPKQISPNASFVTAVRTSEKASRATIKQAAVAAPRSARNRSKCAQEYLPEPPGLRHLPPCNAITAPRINSFLTPHHLTFTARRTPTSAIPGRPCARSPPPTRLSRSPGGRQD